MKITVVKNKKSTNVDGFYVYTLDYQFQEDEVESDFSEIFLIPSGKYMLPDESNFSIEGIVDQKSHVLKIDKSNIEIEIVEV